jgi:nitrogen fixation NifU-like protein
MQVDQLYQELILDHSKRPHGRGLRDPFNGEAHHVNPTCGDESMCACSWKATRSSGVAHAMGCSISQTAASVSGLVNGRSVSDALPARTRSVSWSGPRSGRARRDLLEDGIAFAGVARYPARVKCALLPWMAFKDALVRAMAASTGNETGSTASVAPARSTATDSETSTTTVGGRHE